MKKTKQITVALFIMAFTVALAFNANAAKITWYAFPTTLPNDADLADFTLARPTLMNGLALHGGNPIITMSRSNNPSGVGIKNAFEAGDLIVTTNAAIWRSQLNPTNPNYTNRIGSRVYCPIIAVGNGAQISLSGLSFNVLTPLSILDNHSALETNYAISEVGIIKDPVSGSLFGNGATVIQTGSATQMVDAIVFIGARVGANIGNNGQPGIDAVNNYLGAGGKFRFIYSYTWMSNSVQSVENFERDVMVYEDGQTPTNYLGMQYFPTPRGMLFSLVEPEQNTYTTAVIRSLMPTGTNTVLHWTPNSSTATTGWSYEWDYTGTSTNDYGYVSFTQNGTPPGPDVAVSSSKKATSQPASKIQFTEAMPATNFFQSSP